MDQNAKPDLILQFRKILLNSEDPSKSVEEVLQKGTQILQEAKFPVQFSAVSIFDNANQNRLEIFVDPKVPGLKLADVIKETALFSHNTIWNEGLKADSVTVIPNVADVIFNSYPFFAIIKSVVIAPIVIQNKMIGIFILGKTDNTLTQFDEEVLRHFAVTIGLAYRLQESNYSLTTITQQVYTMNARLHDLDRLKDDFVSVASHELRTPMTAIRSYVWMALHKPDIILSEKLKRYLYRTLISTERLINLVNDMLNVSRIEAGKIEIFPKAFDALALVKDVLEEIRAKADEKLIKLQLMEQKLPMVFADSDKVHQVLLNLLGNSLKFTPPDGIISVGFFTDGKMVEIFVKDTGAGIGKDDLAKLFHKFSRLDNSYVAMEISGGTGLGLYISRSLVELMHGKIWAASEGENKGSTFTFSLPMATQELVSEAEKFHIKPQGEVKVLEPVAI